MSMRNFFKFLFQVALFEIWLFAKSSWKCWGKLAIHLLKIEYLSEATDTVWKTQKRLFGKTKKMLAVEVEQPGESGGGFSQHACNFL